MDWSWKSNAQPEPRADEQARSPAQPEELLDQIPATDLPSDVAALFRWMDLKQVAYRDFSTLRRDAKSRAGQESPQSNRDIQGIPAPASTVSKTPADAANPPSSQPGQDTLGTTGVPARALHILPDRQQGIDPRHAMLPARLPVRRATRSWPQLRGDGGERGDSAQAVAASPSVALAEPPHAPGFAYPKRSDTSSAVDEYVRSLPYNQGSLQRTVLPGAHDTATALATDQRNVSQAREAAQVNVQGRNAAAPVMPAWISKGTQASRRASHSPHAPFSEETPKTTRERVAARWYALGGTIGAKASGSEGSEAQKPAKEPPILAIYSIAGGVGKTTLAASLTRALAAQGERVLLVDMTPQEVLPFFFGAAAARPGKRRVFAPPPGTLDAPVQLADYAFDATVGYPDMAELGERVKRDGKGFSRVILDLGTAGVRTLEDLKRLGAGVLVPLLPDMNSVLGLRARRGETRATRSSDPAAQTWFLLMQFDPSQPLHLDVREVLEEELGDQLLPFVVRKSPAVAEALAQGMTVIDYAPGEGTAKDLQQVAAWLQSLAEPVREGLQQARWSER